MRRHLTEQFTLLASVVKWSWYATMVGIIVGLATTGFLRALAWSSDLAGSFPSYYLFLPLTLVVTAALVRWLAPEATGHGTEKVIEAVHQRMGKIPLAVVPVKLVATVLTLAGGGSAGKEGPCAQIGAGLASGLADLLRVDDVDRRKLVICGISAGFATVFGTPIAGALFGVEVLVLGQMLYDVLLPSFVAGVVGYHVASTLGARFVQAPACLLPQLGGWSFFEMVLLGIWCGLFALMLIETMKLGHRLFDGLSWHWTLRACLGGVLLVAIGSLVSRDYLGLGLRTIDSGLKGEAIPVAACFWKSVATSVTLGSGGSGGVLTPVFFVGTSAGNLFAQLFAPQYLAAYSAIGMVALLAGAANTPIAASVMAMELFGPQIAPFAAIACVVSFLMVGYRSIYPSQVLGVQKSQSLNLPTGRSIGSSGRVSYQPRQTPLYRSLMKALGAYRNRWRS